MRLRLCIQPAKARNTAVGLFGSKSRTSRSNASLCRWMEECQQIVGVFTVNRGSHPSAVARRPACSLPRLGYLRSPRPYCQRSVRRRRLPRPRLPRVAPDKRVRAGLPEGAGAVTSLRSGPDQDVHDGPNRLAPGLHSPVTQRERVAAPTDPRMRSGALSVPGTDRTNDTNCRPGLTRSRSTRIHARTRAIPSNRSTNLAVECFG